MLSWQFLMFMRFAGGIALIAIFVAFVALGKILRALRERARRRATAEPQSSRIARGGAGRAAAAMLLAALALPAFGSLAATATSWPPRSTEACVAPVPQPPLAGSPEGCAGRSGTAPKSHALARPEGRAI